MKITLNNTCFRGVLLFSKGYLWCLLLLLQGYFEQPLKWICTLSRLNSEKQTLSIRHHIRHLSLINQLAMARMVATNPSTTYSHTVHYRRITETMRWSTMISKNKFKSSQVFDVLSSDDVPAGGNLWGRQQHELSAWQRTRGCEVDLLLLFFICTCREKSNW